MTSESLLTQKEGPICTITINRPERRNALNDAVLEGLLSALDGAAKDDQTKVVVLRGAGQEAFSSGFDFFRDRKAAKADLIEATYSAIESFPRPVIAMVYGYAIGGGMALTLCSDLVVAAENARFATPMVKIGAVPPPRLLQRSINVLGLAATRRLLFTARMINADEAKAIGFVCQVAPVDQLHKVTCDIALEIARNAPLSLAATKDAINMIMRSREAGAGTIAELEADVARVMACEDALEGRQAFAEKRAPVFKGK